MTTDYGETCDGCGEPLSHFDWVAIGAEGAEYCPKCAEMRSLVGENTKFTAGSPDIDGNGPRT